MVGYIHRKNEIQTISVVSPDPLSRACKQGKEECRHDSGRKQAGAGGWSNHAWPAGVRGVVCESDRFRETSIKVESGVLESDMRSLKMTPWSLKMT